MHISYATRSPLRNRGIRAKTMSGTTMNPTARKILDYWLGLGWESAPATDVRAEERKRWFFAGKEVDEEVIAMFKPDCETLLQGRTEHWSRNGSSYDVLAGIILGDQLCRHVYRNTPTMYEADDVVLPWARELVVSFIRGECGACPMPLRYSRGTSGFYLVSNPTLTFNLCPCMQESGQHKNLVPFQRMWVLLPFMHSEKLEDQDECVRCFDELVKECREMENGNDIHEAMSMSYKYAVAHRDVIAKWGRFPHRNKILGRQNTADEAKGLEDGSIPAF